MNGISFKIIDNKIIIKSRGRMCETAEELISSTLFIEILKKAIDNLLERKSVLLDVFGEEKPNKKNIKLLRKTFEFLCKMPGHLVPKVVNGSEMNICIIIGEVLTGLSYVTQRKSF
ncbi:MAG: hypothetical protein JRE20_14040 [Deltaproteobacteria bacterium]|nr:hypothetical protein [Deltaproteobacteria bacterium]